MLPDRMWRDINLKRASGYLLHLAWSSMPASHCLIITQLRGGALDWRATSPWHPAALALVRKGWASYSHASERLAPTDAVLRLDAWMQARTTQ